MYESTMQILQENKIKIEHIKEMSTYGKINDPVVPGREKNYNDSFGLGLKLRYRGYVQLRITDCTKRELIHLKQDMIQLLQIDKD